MDILSNLLLGFSVSLSAHNILWCFTGVFLGTVIGMLPGLGSTTGVALLLPLAFTLHPISALILLSGIYYGTQYGASISSILISTPGDSANVVTVFDGYPLALKGRAGAALSISAISHFISGFISLMMLVFLTPFFVKAAAQFGPPELTAIILLGFTGVIGFSADNQIKGIAMTAFGILIATVGVDPQSGIARFTLGRVDLYGGLSFVPVVIGLFAIGEVLAQVDTAIKEPIVARFRDMIPKWSEIKRCVPIIGVSGLLGFVIGVLPGMGATIASFFGYDVARRISKNRDEFGHGALEGVAAPEAASSAAVNGAFVPTLTLGIPGSGTTAILLGAFVVFGLQPGPLLFVEQRELVWGLITSFYLGSVLLLIFNLPLVPLFASVLRLRYSVLYPIIILLSFVGAYAEENSMLGVWVALLFGIVGYLMKRFKYPAAPLVLGLILGPILESSLNQSLAMGLGSPSIFVTRPIALSIMILAVAIPLAPHVIRWFRGRRA